MAKIKRWMDGGRDSQAGRVGYSRTITDERDELQTCLILFPNDYDYT